MTAEDTDNAHNFSQKRFLYHSILAVKVTHSDSLALSEYLLAS